jgi:hypothetical protein
MNTNEQHFFLDQRKVLNLYPDHACQTLSAQVTSLPLIVNQDMNIDIANFIRRFIYESKIQVYRIWSFESPALVVFTSDGSPPVARDDMNMSDTNARSLYQVKTHVWDEKDEKKKRNRVETMYMSSAEKLSLVWNLLVTKRDQIDRKIWETRCIPVALANYIVCLPKELTQGLPYSGDRNMVFGPNFSFEKCMHLFQPQNLRVLPAIPEHRLKMQTMQAQQLWFSSSNTEENDYGTLLYSALAPRVVTLGFCLFSLYRWTCISYHIPMMIEEGGWHLVWQTVCELATATLLNPQLKPDSVDKTAVLTRWIKRDKEMTSTTFANIPQVSHYLEKSFMKRKAFWEIMADPVVLMQQVMSSFIGEYIQKKTPQLMHWFSDLSEFRRKQNPATDKSNSNSSKTKTVFKKKQKKAPRDERAVESKEETQPQLLTPPPPPPPPVASTTTNDANTLPLADPIHTYVDQMVQESSCSLIDFTSYAQLLQSPKNTGVFMLLTEGLRAHELIETVWRHRHTMATEASYAIRELRELHTLDNCITLLLSCNQDDDALALVGFYNRLCCEGEKQKTDLHRSWRFSLVKGTSNKHSMASCLVEHHIPAKLVHLCETFVADYNTYSLVLLCPSSVMDFLCFFSSCQFMEQRKETLSHLHYADCEQLYLVSPYVEHLLGFDSSTQHMQLLGSLMRVLSKWASCFLGLPLECLVGPEAIVDKLKPISVWVEILIWMGLVGSRSIGKGCSLYNLASSLAFFIASVTNTGFTTNIDVRMWSQCCALMGNRILPSVNSTEAKQKLQERATQVLPRVKCVLAQTRTTVSLADIWDSVLLLGDMLWVVLKESSKTSTNNVNSMVEKTLESLGFSCSSVPTPVFMELTSSFYYTYLHLFPTQDIYVPPSNIFNFRTDIPKRTSSLCSELNRGRGSLFTTPTTSWRSAFICLEWCLRMPGAETKSIPSYHMAEIPIALQNMYPLCKTVRGSVLYINQCLALSFVIEKSSIFSSRALDNGNFIQQTFFDELFATGNVAKLREVFSEDNDPRLLKNIDDPMFDEMKDFF